MSAIPEIREAYRFSQRQMAEFLGITRSLLSMVELGKRDLPSHALKRLNTLGMTTEINSGKTVDPQSLTLEQKALVRKQLKFQCTQCTNKLKRLQLKLAALEDHTYYSGLKEVGVRRLLRKCSEKEQPAIKRLSDATNHDAWRKSTSSFKRMMLQIDIKATELRIQLLRELVEGKAGNNSNP